MTEREVSFHITDQEIHRIAAGERAAILAFLGREAEGHRFYGGDLLLESLIDRINEGEHHEGPRENDDD